MRPCDNLRIHMFLDRQATDVTRQLRGGRLVRWILCGLHRPSPCKRPPMTHTPGLAFQIDIGGTFADS
jgi:hypothetical protein